MKVRDFSLLLKKKGANKIKEEYMLGKHGTLTDKQLEMVCTLGEGHGGCSFKHKKRMVKENDKEKRGRTTKRNIFNYWFNI